MCEGLDVLETVVKAMHHVCIGTFLWREYVGSTVGAAQGILHVASDLDGDILKQ